MKTVKCWQKSRQQHITTIQYTKQTQLNPYNVYPNLYYLVKDIFGIEIEFFKIFQMFGIFMALSFVAAYWVMQREYKRLEAEGKVFGRKVWVWENKAPSMVDYISNFVFYFIAGYKIAEAFLFFDDLTLDPQSFLLSARGNLFGGLLLGAVGLYIVYREAQKTKGKTPVQKEVIMHPHENMGNITFVAAVSGLLGAKLFHILENLEYFFQDPIGSILSFSGLTYYGGLICGGLGVLWYTKKLNFHWRHVLDTGGAAMMLAYALGRVGCHVSGDGDWGVVNLKPKPEWMNFLPDWLWAYNYPNNVNKVCNPYVEGPKALIECDFATTNYLIDPVFPTSIYETLMGLVLFGIIWAVRKKLPSPGLIFCLYLVFAGIERYIIEKIRVNNVIDFMGMRATQAEFISIALALLGIGLAVYFILKPKVVTTPNTTGTQIE